MKKMVFLSLICTAILAGFFGKAILTANAEENSENSRPVYERYYTNIPVEKGDSLWSIAERFSGHSGMTTREYVGELKEMNRLTSNQINAGDSLTIVYFSENGGQPLGGRQEN